MGLALSALALTLPRLVPSDSGSMVRAVSFTPLALPVSPLWLLVLLAGVAHAPADPKIRVGAAVVAALAGWRCTCWWFAPQVTGDNPAPAAGAARLTVMTANSTRAGPTLRSSSTRCGARTSTCWCSQEITPQLLAQMDAPGSPTCCPTGSGSRTTWSPGR